MKSRFVLLFLLLVVGQVAVADELTSEKTQDINRLMNITGGIAEQFAAASSQQIFQALKTSRSEIPDRALAVIEKELIVLFKERMAAPGLMEKIISIYDKYYTHEEIRELLAFYQSPVGKKALVTMPIVVNESLLAGQISSRTIGPEMKKRVLTALEKEGLAPKGH